MFKKILVNIVVGAIFSLLIMSHEIYEVVAIQHSSSSLSEEELSNHIADYLLPSFFFGFFMQTLLIFLPYQSLKDYYKDTNREFSFKNKFLLLAAICTVVFAGFGFSVNAIFIPYYLNIYYVIAAASYSLFICPIFHYTADRC